MIIGLDISTSCIGYTFLYKEPKIVIDKCSYVKLNYEDSLDDRFLQFVDAIGNDIRRRDRVFIEDYVLGFGKGKSNATTITKLAHFSGMIRAYMLTIGIVPTYFNATTARKNAGMPVRKGDYENVKEHCYWTLQERFAEHVPIEYTKPRKKDKLPEIKPGCMDATDSLVIALAGYAQIYNKQK